MSIPSDYNCGFQQAKAFNPEIATKYVAHTRIGDPLAELKQRKAAQILQKAMDNPGKSGLAGAPREVRDFFDEVSSPPGWVDFDSFVPGMRMFHRNSQLVLGALLAGVLVEGFSTNISRSFLVTGRLRDQGVRRLKQNNRHLIEIFIPGGLDRNGDGWKTTIRVRLVHSRIRTLLSNSEDWDHRAWGIPLSSAHMAFSITAFSARLLRHIKSLGAEFNEEESVSFMRVWRYTGYVMGIPETVLFKDEADALEIFRIGQICEPRVSSDSIVMANSLINSAPLVLGMSEPNERRSLAKYVFRVSRAMIGNQLADELMFPDNPWFGVLPWFRLQGRLERIFGALYRKFARQSNYRSLTSLLEIAVYDDEGIGYRLPTHVYAEKSRPY